MQNIEGFDFFPLTYDTEGALQSGAELDEMLAHARAQSATDAVLIAHGFRNDATEATQLYTTFLRTFRNNLSRPELQPVTTRRFVVAGVFWPSQSFRETFGDEEPAAGDRALPSDAMMLAEDKEKLERLKAQATTSKQRDNLDKAIELLPVLERNPAAQNEFVKLVLSILDGAPPDPTEGVDRMRKQPGAELLNQLKEARDRELSRGVFDSIAGAVGTFLNLTQWYVMKERSGTVGAAGVAETLRTIKSIVPSLKVHLVGHSLGGRLMASCAKALAAAPQSQPDSMMLLEGAFSHYGFSADDGEGTAGFFRDVIARNAVKGPVLSTFSFQDRVLEQAYAVMSRLAGDRTRALGAADDPFGAVGRNGPQRTTEVAAGQLSPPGSAVYDFKTGVINSLDGSGGLIKDHGDVTNEAVTYAFASAVMRT